MNITTQAKTNKCVIGPKLTAIIEVDMTVAETEVVGEFVELAELVPL